MEVITEHKSKTHMDFNSEKLLPSFTNIWRERLLLGNKVIFPPNQSRNPNGVSGHAWKSGSGMSQFCHCIKFRGRALRIIQLPSWTGKKDTDFSLYWDFGFCKTFKITFFFCEQPNFSSNPHHILYEYS